MSASKLVLQDFMPYLLSVVSNRVSAHIARAYQDKFGLSVTEWRIIAVLGEHTGVSADTVSQRTEVEKSLISRSLKKLIAKKLVSRKRDSEDARRHALRLTRKGEQIYQQVVPLSLSSEQAVLACLSEREQAMLAKLLNKLLQQTDN